MIGPFQYVNDRGKMVWVEACGCRLNHDPYIYGFVTRTTCSWCLVRSRLALAWRSLEEALHVVEMQRECGWMLPEEVQS